VIAAFVFVQFLLYTWLPDFFYARFSLGLTQAGLFSTVYLQGANLLGLLLGGLAGDWLYTRTPAARFWLTASGLLMAAPGVQILGNAPTLWQTEIGAVIYGLGSGLFMANFIVGVMEVVPLGVRASCVGVYNLMGSLVSGFAPWLGGLWKDTVGLPRLFSYAALLCLAAAVVVLVDIRWFFARDFAKAQADLPVAQRQAGSGSFGPDLLDKNLRVQQIE
jgi:MFS family permease